MLIDAVAGQLTIRAQDNIEVFDVYRFFKLSVVYEELSANTVVDHIVDSHVHMPEDSLNKVLGIQEL